MEKETLIKTVKELSKNFTEVIHRNTLKKYDNPLNWDNGVGNRWARGYFSYIVIYSNGNTKIYLEEKKMSKEVSDKIQKFVETNKVKGRSILGIYPIKEMKTKIQRPIRKDIGNKIRKLNCVVCGSKENINCDHKNDLYNDKRVLSSKTQTIEDFQPLCLHCNLQKRQICKQERANKKLYSATQIPQLQLLGVFPWELKTFDKNDPNCKRDTYWYDPIEFMRKVKQYQEYVKPVLASIRN